MENDFFICMACELKKYPQEKLDNTQFVEERLNEFYPRSEYGGLVRICDKCAEEFQDFCSVN
jgi:hypothetical protein